MREALTRSYEPYEKIGVKVDGEYRQLNTALLQIENEFYSTIRPKRTTRTGETPLKALKERGVEYIEVRCIDLDPFIPEGIGEEQIHFLDIFLMHCLLADSPETDADENDRIRGNQMATVYRGRDPALTLERNGESISAREWGREVMTDMAPIANLLDRANDTGAYADALAAMQRRLQYPEETPSARILAAMRRDQVSYFQLALDHARTHRDYFLAQSLTAEEEEGFRDMTERSWHDQEELEQRDRQDFESFLRDYYSQHAL